MCPGVIVVNPLAVPSNPRVLSLSHPEGDISTTLISSGQEHSPKPLLGHGSVFGLRVWSGCGFPVKGITA